MTTTTTAAAAAATMTTTALQKMQWNEMMTKKEAANQIKPKQTSQNVCKLIYVHPASYICVTIWS